MVGFGFFIYVGHLNNSYYFSISLDANTIVAYASDVELQPVNPM